MAALLRKAAVGGIAPAYATKLLAAFSSREQGEKASARHSTVQRTLPEPLSPRELEVLGLFKTDLSGPEIARKLGVALTTVRTHTRNIYRKLDVHSRRAAIRRAEALDLL
jgi:LuxR family maltose regulon positive regulatory protein